MSCGRDFGNINFIEVVAHHTVASVGFELRLLSITEVADREEVEVFAILIKLQVERLKRCCAVVDISVTPLGLFWGISSALSLAAVAAAASFALSCASVM